jgi:hypothetical protein
VVKKMGEDDIGRQLKQLYDKVERIAKMVNELPRVMDEKLKILNDNQGEIIRLLREIERNQD